jgi:translation initiation factor 5B
MGHVDTGKTKILDKLRRTNVQDGEAGGITQQIGATNVPIEVIHEQCKMANDYSRETTKLPGLLIIDTPGHESFSNLRDRGSSLCDIAILVIDIMHSLEPQTIESINLLKKKKVPFVIALNKIDVLYGWKPNKHKDIKDVIENQAINTKHQFEKLSKQVVVGMAEQGLNVAMFWENPDPTDYISMIPTSAHSGDGMGNLMGQLVNLSQEMLAERLAYSEELQATVLEVKAIPGLGTTIDIVLLNGKLREGQTMIVAGTEGPIVTQIRGLLTPSKMQDLRVKNNYVQHKEISGAQGVKIAAKELEKTVAGLNLLIANQSDEIEICREDMEKRLESALRSFKIKDRGVFVQASTLGSLEALLDFLKSEKIPYAGVKIGPVVRKDVMKASVMLEHEPKYTIILAFDVRIERDAQELADKEGVKIFQADIIYHLFDRFTEYQAELKRQKREEFKHVAVFPCKLKVLPELVFAKRQPIVCGVKVEAGVVKSGTPICVPSKEFCNIGILTSMQINNKEVDTAKKGDEVCIKIDPVPGEAPKMFGRHFDEKDFLVSKISRASIDACKDYFREDLTKADWALMVELKKLFEIM